MKKLLYLFLTALCFFIASCEEDETHGCLDSQACNYNSNATIDNNSCLYEIDVCGECGGDGPVEGYDCDGNITAEIGDIMEGGYLFYLDESGEHGLVAAMEDIEGTYEWGCVGTGISGADGLAIGTGYQNTLDIVAGCAETPIAASEALSYESEGYRDWYLPSFNELLEMYNTIGKGGSEGNIGGFANTSYWSSSKSSSYFAWGVNLNNGDPSYSNMSNARRVRVIRAF